MRLTPAALLATASVAVVGLMTSAGAFAATIQPPGTAFSGFGQEVEEGFSLILTTNDGEGPYVGCKTTIASGETEDPAASHVVFDPFFEECETNIGGSLREATVSGAFPWELSIESVSGSHFSGTLEITPFTEIRVAGLPSCSIELPTQDVSVQGENDWGTPPWGMTIDTSAMQVAYWSSLCPGVIYGTAEYLSPIDISGIHVSE
jgi:hypothetical protein